MRGVLWGLSAVLIVLGFGLSVGVDLGPAWLSSWAASAWQSLVAALSFGDVLGVRGLLVALGGDGFLALVCLGVGVLLVIVARYF